MNKSTIGWILIIIGIAAALQGAWFYQNALNGVIFAGGSNLELIINLQLMAIMAMSGVLITIIGVGFALSNKKD